MSISIAVEPPRQPEIEELLLQSSAYAMALYPPESNFLLDIESLEHPGVTFYVARDAEGAALGCAALVVDATDANEPTEPTSAELKRMFVSAEARGRRVASRLLDRIETDAAASGIRRIVLETGDLHDAAQALYRHAGYVLIPQFGQYVGEAHSVCFAKALPRTGD
ncbi:GNAT family N-acetyltransferase [Leifsonia sp. YIM 134122]|uniref:GNAT family N-acetyltransferase n=1 Tax=Leifsonia stereocauli TaxID=3134136 RepID=A0ABU9W7F8_9MICO